MILSGRILVLQKAATRIMANVGIRDSNCRPLFSHPQVLTVTNQLIYNSVCHIAWTFSTIDRKSMALDWDMGRKTQEKFTLQFLKLHNKMPQVLKDVIPEGFGSRVGRWLGMNSVFFLEEFYGHDLSGVLFTAVILFLVLFTYRSLMFYYLWRGLSSNRWTTEKWYLRNCNGATTRLGFLL